MLTCPQCGSFDVCKAGARIRKNSVIQRFICGECAVKFSDPAKVRKRTYNLSYAAKYATRDAQSQVSKNLVEKAFVLTNENQSTSTNRVVSKSFPVTTDRLILGYLWYMKKQGYADGYITGNVKLLKRMVKLGADLLDPESIKAVIAKASWCPGRKSNACDAYSLLLKMQGATWDRPRYKYIAKIPFVPLEKEIDQLIDGCSGRIACFLQLLKETGARPGEAWQLQWDAVDIKRRTIRITPKKGSNPRIARISAKLILMLDEQPRKYNPYIFSLPHMRQDDFRRGLMRMRRRIAHRTKNPRILQITFKTFRHWKGTMEYHKTKDILHVMQVLGHKNIKNTLIYVRLAEELFHTTNDYITKATHSVKQARLLLEAGFEYVLEMDGLRIFRKPKQET